MILTKAEWFKLTTLQKSNKRAAVLLALVRKDNGRFYIPDEALEVSPLLKETAKQIIGHIR